MASPHTSSFICLPFPSNDEAYEVYFGVCIGSAVFGSIGASLFLWQVLCSDTLKGASRSQRCLLVLLAVSDLFADIGVIGRSLFWFFCWRRNEFNKNENFSSHVPEAAGGAVLECWVFFWYLATYLLTFFFAVDVYSAKHSGLWKHWCSQLFTWLFCVVLVGLGVASLWACPPYTDCSEDAYCIAAHLSCTYGPILIVMAALPIFYTSTWHKMKKKASEGPMVDIWQKEKAISRRKILTIIVVFYICWTVNVVDGVLLIAAYSILPGHSLNTSRFFTALYHPYYIYTVWILEALLNPLQGLLNAVAYGNLYVCCRRVGQGRAGVRGRLGIGEASTHTTSWSGEYIDVDFRVDRGNIRQSKNRSKPAKPPC